MRGRRPGIGGPDGGEVDLRHHGDTEVGPGLVDLAVNVRPGTPPAWLAALLRDSVAGLAAYPDPRRAREAVARRHGRSPDEVLLTAGAAEAFVLLARVLRPRRAVVVHPQFTEPEAALRAAGHEVTRAVLTGDFRLDADAVPDDADLVVIGNPTNPTSVLHPAATVARLARPGRVLVVDEAFMDCVPGEPESLASGRLPGAPDMIGAGWAGESHLPGLVVIRSLTKTWGLAGLRAGYLLAGPEPVARLAEAQPLWSVSAPALAAIEACVGAPARAEAEAWARGLAAERERLAAGIRDLGPHVVEEARASFLCLRVPGGSGVRALLRERGYAVRRGDTFPGLGPDWLRVAVRDRDTNDAFLAALADVLMETHAANARSRAARPPGRRPRTNRPDGAVDEPAGPEPGSPGPPGHLEVTAYLHAGHVDRFAPVPTGWARRRPLAWTVRTEPYGHRSLPGGEPMDLIAETVAVIRPPDEAAMRAAREHHGRLTKPPGSLGVLEDLSVRLAGIAGVCPPPLPEPVAVAVFAADHGVHAQGVTPWPQEVTAQMVANFLAGGAVVNAFARQTGAKVGVVDVGVAADLPAAPGLISRKVARGTADMTRAPAMTREQAVRAVETGIEVARDLVAAGNRCLATGDMGIANTTASAALIAAFTGRAAGEVTGRGTGIDDATHIRKIAVVRAALVRAARDLGGTRHAVPEPVPVQAGPGGTGHAAADDRAVADVPAGAPPEPDGRSTGSGDAAAAPSAVDLFRQAEAATAIPATARPGSAGRTAADDAGGGGAAGARPAAGATGAGATGAGPDATGPDATGHDALGVYAAAPDAAGADAADGQSAAVLAGADPVDVLAQVGGLEHAAIAGFVLGAAAERVPVVLDGVIAGAAALVAVALAPGAREFCVAGHRSAEPGHAAALRHLDLRPLVDLDLRLGEGTGALLAVPLIQSAVRVLHEVATFDSAGVAHKDASAGTADPP